ncbi:MAG: hypothetical protein ACYS22_19410, partial [Planctomycetota bacterium]
FAPTALRGMRRAAASEVASLRSGLGGPAPSRLYRTYGTGADQTLTIAAANRSSQVDTDAVIEVRSDRVRLYVRSQYKRAELHALRHTVALPEGFEVRTVRAVDAGGRDLLRSQRTVGEGSERELTIELLERPAAGVTITWTAERSGELEAGRLELRDLPLRGPEAVALDQTLTYVVASDAGLDLRAEAVDRLEPLAIAVAPTWVALPPSSRYRLAYRSRRGDPRLALVAEAAPGRVSATAVQFARLSERYLFVNARLRFRLRLGGREQLLFMLPRGAELLTLEADDQQSRLVEEVPGGVRVRLTLASEARGEKDVEVTYRVPRGIAAPVLEPLRFFDGETPLKDVDLYAALIIAERAVTIEANPAGYIPIEVERLPFVLEGVSGDSLGPAYRATDRSARLTLAEQEIEAVEPLDAIIKLADLTTRIGLDGTTRTEAVYTLLNESLQFLAIRLPEDADLWSVTVNGRSVAVGRGEGGGEGGGLVLRIPVEQRGRSELPLELAITYEEPDADVGALFGGSELSAPRLLDGQAVRILETIWSVQIPDRFDAAERGDRMRAAPISLKQAQRLESLIQQQELALDTAKKGTSRRARERAAAELIRLEQALGDNLAELQTNNRRGEMRDQYDKIGEQSLEDQWRRNDHLLEKGRMAQGVLRKELDRQQKAVGVEKSRDEEAFADRVRFLEGRAWRTGSKYSGLSEDSGAPSVTFGAGGLDAEGLFDNNAKDYRGWYGFGSGGSGKSASKLSGRDLGTGLEPLRASRGLSAGPGLTLSTADAPGYVTLTFRRGDGDADLKLSLTRKRLGLRVGALIGALLGVVLLGVRLRSRMG